MALHLRMMSYNLIRTENNIMDELLNEDMSAAIDKLDVSLQDKELIRSILFEERYKKDREWDDDAVKYIVNRLEKMEATNDIT